MKQQLQWNRVPPIGEETVVVDKEAILKILFHRGGMLLLDRVEFRNGSAAGYFKVSPGNCEGHEPRPGMLVFRGVEITEMAFQLLGVILAQHSELTETLQGGTFVAREISLAKFSGIVIPGDELVVETVTEVDVEQAGGVVKIESGRMIAKVGGRRVCNIASVSIAGFKFSNNSATTTN